MEKLLLPFYRISLFIADKVPFEKMGERTRKLEEKLKALYQGKKTIREYYARNIAIVFALLFWGGGAILILQTTLGGEETTAVFRTMERPSYGEGDQRTELMVSIEGESESQLLSVEVSERHYTNEEIQLIFKEIMEELDEWILSENESLDEVRSDLVLPTSMREGVVGLEWVVYPSDVMDNSGAILKRVGDAGELVELRAILRYREQEAEYTCHAHIYPFLRTAAEEQREALENAVKQADEEGIYGERLNLPSKLAEKEITFRVPRTKVGAILGFLLAFSAVCVFVIKEKNLEKLAELRRRQLIMDYPDLLFKINMLLGAGMTIQSVFMRIAAEYQKNGGKTRYVYEEVVSTCLEMKNGVGEANTYLNFGRRCQESRYIKLGSILSQNLKKGNKDLQDILEQEALAGMDERKNTARKLGEEAGTKLLLPMMLMLIVVLVILLVPAVMAF